jgi:hypothetical protein
MAVELKPGVSRALFARLLAEQQARSKRALTMVALAIEAQTKVNLSGASHQYGTPTTARAGQGPAIISGTLRRSITHTPVTRTSVGWVTMVGTGVGFYPTYVVTKKKASKGRRARASRVFVGKTPANIYGRILEVEGSRAGNRFPFLTPAFNFGARFVAPVIFKRELGTRWTTLL